MAPPRVTAIGNYPHSLISDTESRGDAQPLQPQFSGLAVPWGFGPRPCSARVRFQVTLPFVVRLSACYVRAQLRINYIREKWIALANRSGPSQPLFKWRPKSFVVLAAVFSYGINDAIET